MRDAFPLSPQGLARYGFACQCCGRPVITKVEGLFDNPARGSATRFCSPACRQAAYRRRQAGAAEHAPRQHHGGRTRKLIPTEKNLEGAARSCRHSGAVQVDRTTVIDTIKELPG